MRRFRVLVTLAVAAAALVFACTGDDPAPLRARDGGLPDGGDPVDGGAAGDAGGDAADAAIHCPFEEPGRDFVVCPGVGDAGVCASGETCCVLRVDGGRQTSCAASRSACPGLANAWECNGSSSCAFGGYCCAAIGAVATNQCPFPDTTFPVGQCEADLARCDAQMCRNTAECAPGRTCRQVSTRMGPGDPITFGWCF